MTVRVFVTGGVDLGHIDLLTIVCAVEVARHFGIRKAAAALGIEQSSLGRRLDALEIALGTKLFDRGRQGTLPTIGGAEFLAAVEPAVITIVEACRALQRRQLS